MLRRLIKFFTRKPRRKRGDVIVLTGPTGNKYVRDEHGNFEVVNDKNKVR